MDSVRVAMIGCGGFQRYRLGNLLKVKEAQVVALVDPEEGQIAQTKETHPSLADVPTFNDYRAMLEKTEPDAVMIATPHTQHMDQILDSLDAGAHTCCEKPLVCSVEDAHRVIAKRDATGKIGMVSYQRHFQPEFRYVRAKVESGEAGALEYIQAFQAQAWLRGTKGTWRQLKSLSGGGQLNDSGSHLIDIILWSTLASVDSVSAYGESFGSEVDINSACALRFKNGALGTLSVIGNGNGWTEDVTFFFENLIFYIRGGKLSILDRDGNRLEAANLAGGTTPDANFIHSILGKVENESPFECGLEVIRLTEAAWTSMEQGGSAVKVTG